MKAFVKIVSTALVKISPVAFLVVAALLGALNPLRAAENAKPAAGIVSELTPDPSCGECARPSPTLIQPLFSLPSPVIIKPGFLPLGGADLLRNCGLEDYKIRSPLGQLLIENFNLFESGNYRAAADNFKDVRDSLDSGAQAQEYRLADLGYALCAFSLDKKSSNARKIEQIAVNKKFVALQRLAHYARARFYEDESNFGEAVVWYDRLLKITPETDPVARAAQERKNQIESASHSSPL